MQESSLASADDHAAVDGILDSIVTDVCAMQSTQLLAHTARAAQEHAEQELQSTASVLHSLQLRLQALEEQLQLQQDDVRAQIAHACAELSADQLATARAMQEGIQQTDAKFADVQQQLDAIVAQQQSTVASLQRVTDLRDDDSLQLQAVLADHADVNTKY